MCDISAQMAEILAVFMALQIAEEGCEKLAKVERPGMVVVYSSARDALPRIQEGDLKMLSGGRMPKAGGVRVVEAGLVAAHQSSTSGVEVEFRWVSDECEVGGTFEGPRAANEGAKHIPPLRGPDAFIKDAQAEYKRKQKANFRRMGKGVAKQEAEREAKRKRNTEILRSQYEGLAIY